jgi:hypothetical protein
MCELAIGILIPARSSISAQLEYLLWLLILWNQILWYVIKLARSVFYSPAFHAVATESIVVHFYILLIFTK